MINEYLSSTILCVDRIIAPVYLKLADEKKSVIAFLFHGIFRAKNEISLNVVDPQEAITVQHFRQFVEYYLDKDYVFVSPDDILNGLDNNKNYVFITFDDGYFNNQNALPLLNEYKIPAVFFISANHITAGKCFWWDVLYRERIRSGISVKDISHEAYKLMSKTNEEIEEYIVSRFGESAFEPICDIDRPFTPLEVREFAKQRYVFIGNHTSDHAILTNYSPEGVRLQISNASNTIYAMTGITPSIISYPNGRYSNEVIKISKELGLKLGVTVDFKKNYLPIHSPNHNLICLGRFVLEGNDNLVKQCQLFRSDISLFAVLHRFHRKIMR